MQDYVHQKCTDDVMWIGKYIQQPVWYLYTCDTCVSLLIDANKNVYTTGVFTYLILIQITKTYSPSTQKQNICFIDTKDVKLITYRTFISYTCDIFLIWLLVNIC